MQLLTAYVGFSTVEKHWFASSFLQSLDTNHSIMLLHHHLFGNPWRERFYTRAPTAGRTQYHKEVKKEVFSTGDQQYHAFFMVTNNFETRYFNIC